MIVCNNKTFKDITMCGDTCYNACLFENCTFYNTGFGNVKCVSCYFLNCKVVEKDRNHDEDSEFLPAEYVYPFEKDTPVVMGSFDNCKFIKEV